MVRTLGVVALAGAGVLVGGEAAAETYEVGPGRALAEVTEVPFEVLGPGDVVEIHWRGAPYRAKFVVGGGGTADAPLVIRGVPGPDGELPVIDGDGATTRAALDYWNQARSVVKIGGSNTPADAPEHVVVEGLDIRGGHPDHTFTDSGGVARSYAGNAAAIHVENGAHVTIRGCALSGSANGLFVSSEARDVTVERNHVFGNGLPGDIYVHNSYTEADGIVFQYNHYGPLADGAPGNNLKDRSAGLVVRYNWFEGGNRQLDLVDSDALAALPSYRTTLVYGNVLVERDGDGNRQIVHYGGDSGDEAIYRKGTLYFYGNTMVSSRTDRTTLFRLSSTGEAADVRNNIFFVTGAGGDTELVAQDGDLRWGWNWIKPGWVESFAGATGTIVDLGGRVEGDDPGFVDVAALDVHLRADAAARDVCGALADGVPPLLEQYLVHQGGEPRPVIGTTDLGAFEHCDGGCVVAGDDAGVGGGGVVDAGTAAADDGAAGCGCRAGGATGAPGVAALALVVSAGALARRRRPRRAR